MARPPKQQRVDYFPHMCIHGGKTLFILEQKYHEKGYTFWFKLLEKLGSTAGHALDLSDTAEWELLQARSFSTAAECEDIMELLTRLNAIDPNLWKTRRIVWCQNFVDNLAEVYRKRNCAIPLMPVVSGAETPTKTENKVVSVAETPTKTENDGVSGAESAGRIGEERRGQERITPRDKFAENDPHQNDASLTAPGCLAQHSWETFRTIWIPALQSGKFIGEDACQKLWDKTPAMWNQWLASGKNYVICRRVREGFPMNPLKFLESGWKDWQTPETPSGIDVPPDFFWRDERDQDEARFAEGQRLVKSNAEGYRPRDKLPFESDEEYAEKREAGRLQMVPVG